MGVGFPLPLGKIALPLVGKPPNRGPGTVQTQSQWDWDSIA